jgi:hypothetical protein
MRKVDGLSFIFVKFYVPALTPRLSSTETSLQLSENITLRCLSHTYMYRCRQQRDLDRQQAFGPYHLKYAVTCCLEGRII